MHSSPSPRRTNPRLAPHKRKFRRDICNKWNRHSDPELPGSASKTFFDFVRRGQRETGDLTVTTRLQARSKPKRVIFADETSVTGGEDVTQREEADGVPTEDSVRLETEFSRVTAPNGDTPVLPDAEDVDPLTDEELRWANLKIVLRGEESTLSYRAARDAWKMSDHFIQSEDNVLYYVWERGL
ncbi:hypothetical protein PHMEG_00012379 [Phytophthora megakarya]|uniref:Uncharacterized protein n=1 Tax=Phytophthora megakarya TaxID=4795 RepID=A0A225WB02_9STRA|nr:hypothetical protein PHMEG_00012379 [Phytophthora megakarya]